MPLLGLKVDAVHTLTNALWQWGTLVDQVDALVSQAEVQSDVPANASGLLDDIGATGIGLARALAIASHELTSFRIADLSQHISPPLLAAVIAQEAMALGHVIGAAQSGESRLVQERHARLLEIMASVIDDPDAAAAAAALVVRGLPPNEAVEVAANNAFSSVYSAIAAFMAAGIAPAAAPLPAGLFPEEYQRWHANPYPDVAQIGGITAYGTADTQFRIQNGRVSELASLSSTAAWLGPTATPWLGEAIAPIFKRATQQEVTQIGQMVAVDARLAASFFTELGATGTVEVPETLHHYGADLFTGSIGDFATGLAGASGTDFLGFTGAEFIDADMGNNRSYQSANTYPEHLLLAAGIEHSFLFDATERSLERRTEHSIWLGSYPSNQSEFSDPRSLAIQGVINNSAEVGFVLHLGRQGTLGSLIDPAVSFRVPSDVHSNPQASTSQAELLAVAGTDRQAFTAVVGYLHDSGGYEQFPVAAADQGILTDKINEHRVLSDQSILHGLSAMFSLAFLNSAEILPDPLALVGQQAPVPPLLEHELFSGFHRVLLSGSGDVVATMANELVVTAGMVNLERIGELDTYEVSYLLGVAQGLHLKVRLDDAKAQDQSADSAANAMGLVSFGLSVAATNPASGPVVTVAALTLSALGLFDGPNRQTEAFLEQYLNDGLDFSLHLREAGLVALFATGLVRTAAGKPVEFHYGTTGRFSVRDKDGNGVRLDDSPIPEQQIGPVQYPHDSFAIDELQSFIGSAAMRELHIDGVPLISLMAEFEAADTTLEVANSQTLDHLNQ